MKAIFFPVCVAAAAMMTGCAGLDASKMSYSAQMQVNTPQKSSDCYDASVLLGVNLERAKDITKKVLVAIDATVEAEQANSLKAQRNRHLGLLVASGGEELFVNWNSVAPEKTFLTVATKTGFVGGAGQKAWSCQTVDEMIKMAN